MGNDGNYWAALVEGKVDNSTGNVRAYFQKRAAELGESSGDKVTAVFEKSSRLEAENTSLLGIGSVVEGAMAMAALTHAGHVRKDANELYNGGTYAFEIRSNSYRFRVFEVDLKPVYPLEFDIDEGVYDELDSLIKFPVRRPSEEKAHTLCAENDDEVDDLFKAILKTKKMRYLIVRLIELASGK